MAVEYIADEFTCVHCGSDLASGVNTELLSLFRYVVELQRTPCNHSGIGLPGCYVCDPQVIAVLKGE